MAVSLLAHVAFAQEAAVARETVVEAPVLPPEEALAPTVYNTVRLQGLNKVTARTTVLEARLGVVARFGNLEIIARACRKSAEDERPENAALLEVWELKPNESPQRIFHGWMFSSSPGVSALENPVYDLVVLECIDRELQDSR